MAFNVGSAPAGVLAKALTGNIFVEKGLAFMNEGDKDGYNVYKHDIANILRTRSANPASTVSNTSKKAAFKRTLAVVESFETLDPGAYHNYWKEYQPEGEFNWEGLPSEVQASLEEIFLGSAAAAVEDELTNGTSSLVTGLIEQLESAGLTNLNGADATPTQVVDNTAIAFRAHGGGSGDTLAVALTSSNVFDKLELLIKYQTKAMRKRAGRKFMVNHKTADLVREAQRNAQYKGVDFSEEGVMRYGGYDIIENPSFPDDAIFPLSSYFKSFKLDK